MELLNYISSYIGKYKIKDIINIVLAPRLVAIRVYNRDDINLIAKRLKKDYDVAEYIMAIKYTDGMCVSLSYRREKILIYNHYEDWYSKNGYEIIEIGDIIWNY